MRHRYESDLRSWRINGALVELRVARRLGRRLTDDEARALEQYPDPLRCRAIALAVIPGARLVKRAWGLSVEAP